MWGLLRRIVPVLLLVIILVGIPLAIIAVQANRKGLSSWELARQMISRAAAPETNPSDVSDSILPKGPPVDFLVRSAIGEPFEGNPRIAHVLAVDLDNDGLLDVLACDCLSDRVVWMRQHKRGEFTEIPLGETVRAPAHVTPSDFDKDGDLDLLVASMGMVFPNNDRIGSVVVLENDGSMRFRNRVLVENIARVTDISAGDFDGDGDLDLAVGQFGYDDGETRWMENLGGWQFRSHMLQTLSGPIVTEAVDMDGDGDPDILTLVSQEWEEIYVFQNDGTGQFQPRMIFGATNEDFGSSWIVPVDMDSDGDLDVLYSNGDAFDYMPPRPRPWHGVQWLENTGDLHFTVHRIVDFAGASSPQPVDLDLDGDIDVVVVSAYNLWENESAQSMIWLENNGRMQFSRHDVTNDPTHLVTLTVGDFDGDAKPDLVTGGLHVYPPYDRLGRVTLWTNRWPGALDAPRR